MKFYIRFIALMTAFILLLQPVCQPAEAGSASIYEKALAILTALDIVREEDTFSQDTEKMITEEEFDQLLSNLVGWEYTDAISMEFGLQTALKKLVDLMGYSVRADAAGGYPVGYLVVADELHLLDGLLITSAGELTVGQAMTVLCNAMEAAMLVQVSYGQRPQYESSQETLLSKYKNIYSAKGILTDNGITSLTGKTEIPKDMVKIDDIIYEIGDFNCRQWIGQKVVLYFEQANAQSDRQLKYIEPASREGELLTVRSDDILSFSDGTLYYLDESGKERAVDISPSIDVIYNNKAIDSQYDKEVFAPSLGSVCFIDHNGDGHYDVAVSKSYTKNMVAGFIDEKDYKVRDIQKAEVIDLDETDPDSYTIYKTDGTEVSFAYLEEFDVLSVAKSRDGEYTEIVVSNRFAEGIVEAKTSDGSEKKFRIGGKEYKISPEYESVYYNFPLGDYGTFLLNFNKEIVFYENESNGLKFGYIIEGAREDALSQNIQLKILTSEDTIEIFDCCRTVIVDGIEQRPEDSGNALTEKVMLDGKTTERFKQQLIRYRLNGLGEITEIDTAQQTKSEPEDTLIRYVENKSIYWRTGPRAFISSNATILPSDGMKIFIVPPTSVTTANETDPQLFKVRTTASLSNDYLYNKLDGYTISSEREYAHAIVTTEDYTAGITSGYQGDFPLILVQNITEVINENGELVKKIYGIRDNLEDSVALSREAQFKNFPEGDGIRPGDIVRVMLENETAVQVELAYRHGYSQPGAAGSGMMQTKYYFKAGYAYSCFNNVLQLTSTDLSVPEADPSVFPTDLESYRLQGTVYVYDETNAAGPFALGSMSDLVDFRHGGIAVPIAIITGSYNIKTIIVFQ